MPNAANKTFNVNEDNHSSYVTLSVKPLLGHAVYFHTHKHTHTISLLFADPNGNISERKVRNKIVVRKLICSHFMAQATPKTPNVFTLTKQLSMYGVSLT